MNNPNQHIPDNLIDRALLYAEELIEPPEGDIGGARIRASKVIREAATALESAQREIAELRRAGDELADKLWVLRCESGDELSRNAAERACDEWAALNKERS